MHSYSGEKNQTLHFVLLEKTLFSKVFFYADLNNKTKNNWKRRNYLKTDFIHNPKKCVFRKITTDFENRLSATNEYHFMRLFGHWPNSPYSTEQFQSIFQPMSIYFAHFRIRRENLCSHDTTFVRVLLVSGMLSKTISDDHQSLKFPMPYDR